jgi:predicted ATPase
MAEWIMKLVATRFQGSGVVALDEEGTSSCVFDRRMHIVHELCYTSQFGAQSQVLCFHSRCHLPDNRERWDIGIQAFFGSKSIQSTN